MLIVNTAKLSDVTCEIEKKNKTKTLALTKDIE